MENYSSLHQVCVQVFDAVSKMTSIFILPLFMTKIVFSSLLGEGSKSFTILKGVLIYFCLTAAFPLIIETLFSMPEAYLPKYNGTSFLSENAPDWAASSIIPFALNKILEVLLAGLYWVAYYLHIFFMIIMCSMAPVVFLCGTILGLGFGLEIFMGLLIVGSSWPIIWHGFDQVHFFLVSHQIDEFGAKCLELLITLFKGLAPITFASLAIKSPAGQAVAKSAQVAIGAGKLAAFKSTSSSRGFNQKMYSPSQQGKNQNNNQRSSAFQDRSKDRAPLAKQLKSQISSQMDRLSRAQKQSSNPNEGEK